MDDVQIWNVPLSPAQRWVLHELAFSRDAKIPNGQEGRRFRRFMRAFGLATISASVRKHNGVVPMRMVSDEAPRRHTITAENLDYALEVLARPKEPRHEMLVGELFDLLEDIKAGRPFELPADLPAFDAAAEDWSPPKPDGAGPDEDEGEDGEEARPS